MTGRQLSSRPIRVLHVVPDLRQGGAERHATTLLSTLDREAFAPSLISIGEEGALFAALAAAQVPAVSLGRTKKQAMRALVELVDAMRRQRPDVVIVRGYNAEILGRIAAVVARVPRRIVWVHNCGDIGPRGRVRRLLDRALDRVTDAYFGVAHAQLPYLTDDLGYSAEKIHILHNGVDPERYRRGDGARVRAELGIKDDAPVIGIVAALRPEKDHITLLHAVREIADDVPGLRLLVVGDGPQRAEIVRVARELGLERTVLLTGGRSDVADLLAATTVFTLSSFTIECFPVALLEAMAASRPAVCTDVGGVGELLEDGVTGYLVPPRNPSALAGRLRVLLADPDLRERMGAAARIRVEERFSLETTVAQSAQQITEVVRGAQRSRDGGRGKGPVRLTVVLDRTFLGGVETLLLHLFRQLDPDIVRPRLVCLHEAGPLAADIRAAGFDVTVLDRTDRWDVRTLPRLIRTLRGSTDVVLVPHHHRAALALGPVAAKIARVRATIVAPHDMDLTSVGRRVLPQWAVNSLGAVDVLALLTERQGRYLHEEEGVGRYPWARTREVVVPNGIPIGPAPSQEDRVRARELLGAGDGDIVVGVVGRLSPQKAHEVLLDAVGHHLRDVPQVRLAVIGDGSRAAELRRYAETLGIADRTAFLGIRRDVPALLPGLDVACLSSVHEGVPLALMEAMAAGVPIVATDCGSVRDIVEDGVQGFVVPVRDARALADRLRLMATDPQSRARLAGAARTRAEHEFGIELTARRYEQLLVELVQR